ncbi:GNAT family N-acetyltransferase [Rhodococcus sp. X156]|uniref:GNAT family N-acetyltransferase n=1 Tax=Rhodococcus sp. X156 TaxID=2499145 RepID=UPI000FD6BD5D|nr:GNAT family N-acetyltransferase [Rhodococcus sp. X156]
MSRRVANLTLDSLEQLPGTCRQCVFWELSPHAATLAAKYGQTDLEKEAWLSGVLLDWGSCGKIISVDGRPVGYAIYAPPTSVPRAAAFPTSPVSSDAVLLTALHVVDGYEGGGLGKVLVQAVAKDLVKRGVKAVEAFGREGLASATSPSKPGCVIPAGFLRRAGFEVVRPHEQWPRLRLELRAAISWKEDVEAALDRLLESVSLTTVGKAPSHAM